MTNIFDLTDGYYLITNAEKKIVEQAITVVKGLKPNTYESIDLESILTSFGYMAEVRHYYNLEEIKF